MHLEATETTAASPQDHPHWHALRRFGVGKDQRGRRAIRALGVHPQVNARATTSTAADNFRRLELADVTADTGPHRAKKGLDEVVFIGGEGSR